MAGRFTHSARLFRIALTLAQYDALFGLEAAGVSPITTTVCKLFRKRRYRHLREGERLAKALEALGPTFIKVGQALSVRPDLVGDAIADDLSNLRDQLPPFDSAIARQIVERELDQSVDALFRQFDDTPVAAASIAQVHFAVTHAGEEVAVKILRPDIEAAFKRDMELVLWLAQLAEQRMPQWRRLKPVESVTTFTHAIRFELDMRYEAAAAAEMRENMKHDKGFYIPHVYWPLTSERVLTTERIKGISLNDRDALKAANVDFTKLVEHAATAFFHQVFRDGFFHADLHPGNVFVLPDNSLAAVDFGIVGRIDRDTQLYLAEMLWAFLQEDYEKVARIHIHAGYVPRHTSVKLFAQANRAIAKPIFGKPLNEISIARLLGQLFKVAEQFEMQAQPQLLMLQKTMMVTEGVGRMLNPEVNMWKLAEPLIATWAKANLSPTARIRETLEDGASAVRALPSLVKRIERVMDDVQQGGIALHPTTLQAIRGDGQSSARWLWFGWAALLMLGAIFVLELKVL